MATSRKIESIAGFRLEAGLDNGGSPPHNGWGDSNATQTLGSGNAISRVGFTPSGMVDTILDDSIEGQAFQDIPNQMKKTGGGQIDGYYKYQGIDRLMYWMFGYEDGGSSVVQQFIFTVSGISVTPTAGATYTNNSSTFTVRDTTISSGAGTIRGERTTGSNDPDASGTLTKATGTGDATITYSAYDGDYYRHLYELDKHERAYTAYRTAEQTAGDYNSGDRKNRMATIAIKRGTNDHRYPNSMCKRFSISSESGGLVKWSTEFIGYQEQRGDYSSSSWTFPTGASGSTLNSPHHQQTITLGPTGSLVAIGVSSWEIGVDIPLEELQDTESGLYIAEPVGEGKYPVSGSLTVSRHTADTLLSYRDNFTDIALKIIAVSGNYELNLLLQDVRIKNAPLSDDEVTKVNIEFELGPEDASGTPFASEVGSIDIIQESPILLISQNKNSTNEMRRE